MFKGINKVFILGLVYSDPDIRYTSTGKPVATVLVSTETSWRHKTEGRSNSKIEWHRIVFYGRFAENTINYVKKGQKIYVEGSIKSNKWQDKDGITRYTTEIMATNLQILNLDSNTNENNLFNKKTSNEQKNENLSENDNILNE